MAANNIRLAAGPHRAIDRCTVSLFQGTRQVSWCEIPAGGRFDVPHHVNGFWSAVTYHPDFGDQQPRFVRVAHEGQS